MTGIEPAYSAWEVGRTRFRLSVTVRVNGCDLQVLSRSVRQRLLQSAACSDIAVTPLAAIRAEGLVVMTTGCAGAFQAIA